MARPKGGYKVDGKRVPGVTTVIGRFKDSGGLMYWACEQGKAIERGEIHSLYDRRDEAAEAGTLAHSLVEASIRDPDGEIAEIINTIYETYPENVAKQAIQGYENYLKWAASTNMVVIEQEIPLVSKEFKFGGTPDAIMVQGELALGDWKTSNAIYPDHLIQLAAYKVLWEENHPNEPITGGFHLCRFSKEHADFAHHYWAELNDAWEQFLLFRRAYDIDKKLKKRV